MRRYFKMFHHPRRWGGKKGEYPKAPSSTTMRAYFIAPIMVTLPYIRVPLPNNNVFVGSSQTPNANIIGSPWNFPPSSATQPSLNPRFPSSYLVPLNGGYAKLPPIQVTKLMFNPAVPPPPLVLLPNTPPWYPQYSYPLPPSSSAAAPPPPPLLLLPVQETDCPC